MRQREVRFDAMALPGKLTAFVTPQAAHEHLTGQQSSVEAARLRMLSRMGLDVETGPAADARKRMLSRLERRREK